MATLSNWARDLLADLWASKKWRTAALGLVVGLAGKLGLSMDAESLALILAPLVAYIVGQGIADQGKEAAALSLGPEDLEEIRMRMAILETRMDASMEDARP